jgi:hypothetical protein
MYLIPIPGEPLFKVAFCSCSSEPTNTRKFVLRFFGTFTNTNNGIDDDDDGDNNLAALRLIFSRLRILI